MPKLPILPIPSENLRDPVYRKLIFEGYSEWFDENFDPEALHALACFDEDQPIGLIIAEWHKPYPAAHVQSLFVLPEYRQKNIATRLLKTLKTFLDTSLSTNYELGDESSVYFENILQNLGWQTPTIDFVRYFFHAPSFHPKWFDKHIAYPKGLITTSYSSLSDEEKADFRHKKEEKSFPEEVYPLQNSSHIETSNSLFLRKDKEIIGWCLTHDRGDNCIIYTGLFLYPEYRSSGSAGALLAESIKKQQSTNKIWSVFETNPKRVPKNWISFIKKRLISHAHHYHEMKSSFID